jgi:murein DD-endopeptidase MepM/ murein hydrolase activator NlpD
MKQPYFILVLAHSLHGRIRRFHIDQKVVLAILGLALLGCFTLFGAVSSYVRMAWKVANYNNLRQETEFLRARYQKLQNEVTQTHEQMAKLQIFASEVAVAYGIRKDLPKKAGPLDSASAERLVPTFSETLEQYNLLKSASINTFSRQLNRRWLVNATPALWPVMGRLLSHFGTREDPFRGHQAFHSGLDISAPVGTPVVVTADGIVRSAEWFANYGRLIVVDHGGGVQTYYAHLSRFDVIPGQEVRAGQVIGATGATGRVTSPHLHYEVRHGGSPVNPYSYLKAQVGASQVRRDFSF